MKPYSKRKRRYSNYYDPTLIGAEIGAGVAASQANGSIVGNNTSGSGAFNWQIFSSMFNNLVNGTSSVLQSIYGTNNVQQAQYTQEMLKQERRTTTILWVIIGLVLALGVFLLIRKTK